MNHELKSVLEYLEREKGVDRESLIEAVETSLVSASRKSFEFPDDVSITIDRETLDINVFVEKKVVAIVKDSKSEIGLEDARKHVPGARLGSSIKVNLGLGDFGRIAAQTAKQVIIQKIKDAERDTLYNEYIGRVGEVLTGVVRRYERGAVILDLGRVEAVLSAREKIPVEDYAVGTRLRVYLVSVKKSIKGPEIIVSRTHPDLVRKLFEMEVSEIHEGTVEIKAIAREPGYRTKVAVTSSDSRVDALGACVGMKGARVKNIVKELGGEKVDIIKWSDDIREFIANAFAPVAINQITVDQSSGIITVLVNEEQLSLCIGKKGQNARLCAKLTGWKIDIDTLEDRERRKRDIGTRIEAAKEDLKRIPGLTEELADCLIKGGFTTIEGIVEAEAEDIAETEGIDEEQARMILEGARSLLAEKTTSSAAGAEDDGDAPDGGEESPTSDGDNNGGIA